MSHNANGDPSSPASSEETEYITGNSSSSEEDLTGDPTYKPPKNASQPSTSGTSRHLRSDDTLLDYQQLGPVTRPRKQIPVPVDLGNYGLRGENSNDSRLSDSDANRSFRERQDSETSSDSDSDSDSNKVGNKSSSSNHTSQDELEELVELIFGLVPPQGDMANPQGQAAGVAAGAGQNGLNRSSNSILSILPKFDGKEHAGQFLRDFEDICLTFGHNTVARRHPFLKRCLIGKAKTWSDVWQAERAQANPAPDEQTYYDAFRAKYAAHDRHSRSKDKKKFENAKKTSDQTYEEFAEALQFMAIDMDPAPGVPEIIEQCIKGVPDEAKERLIANYPADINALMAQLKILDQVQAEKTSSSTTEALIELLRKRARSLTRTSSSSKKSPKKESPKKKSPKKGKKKVNLIKKDPNDSGSDSNSSDSSSESDSSDEEEEKVKEKPVKVKNNCDSKSNKLDLSELAKKIDDIKNSVSQMNLATNLIQAAENSFKNRSNSNSRPSRQRDSTPHHKSDNRSRSRSSRTDSLTRKLANFMIQYHGAMQDNQKKSGYYCYKCGKEGHYARDHDSGRYRSNSIYRGRDRSYSRDYSRDRNRDNYRRRDYSRDNRYNDRGRDNYRRDRSRDYSRNARFNPDNSYKSRDRDRSQERSRNYSAKPSDGKASQTTEN